MKYFEEKHLQDLMQTKTVVIETRLSSQAPSHSTPIWVIVEDHHVYVRSYRGQAGRWYQEITAHPFAVLHLNGEQLTVQAVRITDEATITRVSQALLQKYPTSSYAGPMVRDEILATTLRLEPASLWPAALPAKGEGRRNRFSQEERAFLLNGTKTGKLATVRADGRGARMLFRLLSIWMKIPSSSW